MIAFSELLAVATEAAYLGGRRTLAYFQSPIDVELKDNATPVTRADREAETVIRERIARSFPSHAIIGEEHGESAGDTMYRWIIDPIDGTKTFIHGVPLYGVLVAVEVEGQVAAGAVYMPGLDEMVAAATGLGCSWNGRPAKVSQTASLAEATLLTTSVSSSQARSDAYDRLAAATRLQRTWGDCYGYVLVATGRADIMLDAAMSPWDCAPLLPIMREAGGHFTTWDGTPTIWGPDAFATNDALYAEVLAVLRSEQRR